MQTISSDFVKNKLHAFGKRLVECQKLGKKSDTDIAKYLGISGAAVGKYANGKGFPTMENFIKLCNYLNVTPNDLISTRSRVFRLYSDRNL